MRKFLILVVIASSAFLCTIQLYLYVVRAENESKLTSADYILLGDSHTEYINDDRVYNLSFAGCTYNFHERHIKSIPLVGKKVILNVAPHNFGSQYHDRYFSKDHEEWRRRFFTDLPAALDLYKFQLLPRYSSITLFQRFGEAKIVGNQKQDLSQQRLEYTLSKHFGESTFTDTLEINAFDRIIGFLNKSEVEYILLQMPHHPSYWENIPPTILTHYQETVGRTQNLIRCDSASERHYLDGDHILGRYQGEYLNSEILDKAFLKEKEPNARKE